MVMAKKAQECRVFVIGPMSDVTGEPLPNLQIVQGALLKIFGELGVAAVVDIPQEKYGSNIPADVFHAIDASDLVVADISRRSPNVMYELAFAHALGVPTILVDCRPSSSNLESKPIFYLTQDRTEYLADFKEAEVIRFLSQRIAHWRKSAVDLSQNPLTAFYGMPLVDISAVAGIAAGYAENFVKPIQNAIQGKFDKQPVAAPGAIVVVLPTNLDGLRQEALELRKRLAEGFGEANVLSPALIVAEDRDGTVERRTVTYVNGVVVDLPRTLFPLRNSARYRRYKKAVENNPQLLEKMEQRLIDAFGKVLKSQEGVQKELVFVTRPSRAVRKMREIDQRRRSRQAGQPKA
jgi:hypothetical protein